LDTLQITLYGIPDDVMEVQYVVALLGAAVGLSVFIPLIIGFMFG
jgi:hypothetical protein